MISLNVSVISGLWRVVLCVLVLGAGEFTITAETLNSDVIGLFPKTSTELSYADLAKAREFSWFAQFKSQVLPLRFSRFDQFLESPSMGLGTRIDGVAWATVSSGSGSGTADSGDGLVVVATGQFDIQTAESFLETSKMPFSEVDGDTLYASQTGWGEDTYFAFLDSNTVIFGSRAPVARIVGLHHRGEPSLLTDESMMALVNRVNGEGIFWGVLNATGARDAITRLVPESNKFPDASRLTGKLTALVVRLSGLSDTGVNLDFQAFGSSPQDTLLLSQLLQAGVLLRRYQATDDNPGVGDVLEAVTIDAKGSNLEISLHLTNEQVWTLIESDTFARF